MCEGKGENDKQVVKGKFIQLVSGLTRLMTLGLGDDQSHQGDSYPGEVQGKPTPSGWPWHFSSPTF